MAKQSARKSQGFLARITLMLSALVMFAFASVAFTVQRIAREIDIGELRRAIAAIEHGLEVVREQMGTRTDFAYSDDTFREVVLQRRPAALDQQLYISLLLGPNRTMSYIVDGRDAVIHASRGRMPVSGVQTKSYLAPIASTLKSLRENARSAIVPAPDGNGHAYVKDFGLLPYLEGSLIVDIADFDGRPALIMAAALLPKDPALIVDPEVTVVVHAIFLANGVYDLIGHAANVPSLGPASGLPGKGNYVLRNKAGEPVTTVSWDFAPPGQRVIEAAAPIFLWSFALFLIMAAGAIAMLQRLTAKLAAGEASALFAARHDAATGLANRAWFKDNFEIRVQEARISGRSFVLALIDLDYFKPINDNFGHAAGDQVLIEVANRLKSLERHVAFAGRLGGDEFVALSFDQPVERASAWGDELRRALMQPVQYGNSRIDVSTSIGMVVAGGAERTALMAQADLALYRAKREGRGCVRLYDPAIDRDEAPADANVDVLREAARKLRGDAAAGGPANESAASNASA